MFNRAQDHMSGRSRKAKTEGGVRWPTADTPLGSALGVHTCSISRIGQLAPTPILSLRGLFEIASTQERKKKWQD